LHDLQGIGFYEVEGPWQQHGLDAAMPGLQWRAAMSTL
jgi:hypothetical protein